MKTYWLVAISIGLGITLGVATSWARLDHSLEPDPLVTETIKSQQAAATIEQGGPLPSVAIDADEHDFGRIASGSRIEFTFVFHNVGEAPLRLASGGTSCAKCTIASIPPWPIPPGDSGEVVIGYNPNSGQGDFRQSATIETNDPLRPHVELTVTGNIVVPLDIAPHEVVFTRLTAGETRTAHVTVVSNIEEDFTINSWEMLDRETAAFYDVAIEPLPADELEKLHGKRGYQLAITVKPGMPLGAISQNLLLKTNLSDLESFVISIKGSIESDVSIAGGSFDQSRSVLFVGPIERRVGGQRKLLVLVRGENRHQIKVSVASCTAPLEATLGEPTDSTAGAVLQIPLVIKVPPGAQPVNHLIDFGKITLETTHPDAKQLRVWVQFAVQD